MQTFTDHAIPDAVRSDIAARLAQVEADHDVTILLAVESGSRAWGFPSPDSDYDVRFLYLHRRDWYLTLTPGRDVIERPIVDEIDLNGWDIRKTLGLLMKSNATVREWMESPIRYRPDHPAVARLGRLADEIFDPRSLARHYAALGRNATGRWLKGEGDVPVKKYFYALRPALAIRHLRLHPEARLPMNLHALMERCALPDATLADVHGLVALKARSNECSNVTRIPVLDALIRDELSRAEESPRHRAEYSAYRDADTFFLELVNL